MKIRVHELAKELQISSKEALATLRDIGEYVKSASSTIEKPIADKVRAHFPDATRRASPNAQTIAQRQHPIDEIQQGSHTSKRVARPPVPPPGQLEKRPRREFYRGTPPPELTKWILDYHIVPSRHWNGRKPPSGYFDDEVKDAVKLTREWAPTLLSGLTKDNILTWISSNLPVDPSHAVQLHRAGITPKDIGWSYQDNGSATLAEKLARRIFTLQQVIDEAIYRRDNS